MRRFTSVSSAALFWAALVGGCAQAPFVSETVPYERPPDDLQVVSVCYAASATTREEIAALAREECLQRGSRVEFWRHDTMLNECPILAKTRVSYLCVPPPKQP